MNFKVGDLVIAVDEYRETIARTHRAQGLDPYGPWYITSIRSDTWVRVLDKQGGWRHSRFKLASKYNKGDRKV